MTSRSSYVEVELKDGSYLLLESEGYNTTERQLVSRGKVSRGGDIVSQSPLRFNQSLGQVCVALDELAKRLQYLDVQPEEIEIDVGIQIEELSGRFAITRGENSSNFRVRLKWTSPRRD